MIPMNNSWKWLMVLIFFISHSSSLLKIPEDFLLPQEENRRTSLVLVSYSSSLGILVIFVYILHSRGTLEQYMKTKIARKYITNCTTLPCNNLLIVWHFPLSFGFCAQLRERENCIDDVRYISIWCLRLQYFHLTVFN